MDYDNLTLNEKRELLFAKPAYVDRDTTSVNINADYLKFNSRYFEECDRELYVSLFPMLPLLEQTVPLEDADYILYSHPYARIEDMSPVVLQQLHQIDERRRPGAEIIVVGKSSNAEALLAGSIQNITFWPSHYTERLGQKFHLDITDEYFVYDIECGVLNIWPVNGCLRKCKFCRRCYMDIPFESLSLDYIKAQLDWYKDNCPEKLRAIDLRAENLTEYGFDLGNGITLADLIDLISSYDEVKEIYSSIGFAYCEITDEILDAMCRSGKFVHLAINPEAGNNRLLQTIGKDHTCERAIYIATRLRKTYPDLYLVGTVMVGLPTETLSDIYDLADLCVKLTMNHVLINKYGAAPKSPLNELPQLSPQLIEYHLRLMVKLIKEKTIASGYNDILAIDYIGKVKKGARRDLIGIAEAATKFGEFNLKVRDLRMDVYSPPLGRFIQIKGELRNYIFAARYDYLKNKAKRKAN